MDKTKYSIIRAYIYVLFFLFLLSGGLFPLIFMPVYKRIFAPRLRYRDLKIFAYWLHAYRIMWRYLADKNYRTAFAVKMNCPPRTHTDTRLVRIKQSWTGRPDDCDQCEAACCALLRCPLLDEDNRCLGYGSLFFEYLHCGRFPETQRQIDYYQCPKWEAVENLPEPEQQTVNS
jgi:hypothetical protein